MQQFNEQTIYIYQDHKSQKHNAIKKNNSFSDANSKAQKNTFLLINVGKQ